MKATWVDFIVIALYVAGLVAISWYTHKKNKSVNDFLLAGKGVGGVMAAFAYGTTYFSAVIFIGYAGKFGYEFGLSALWIGIANAVVGSLCAWLVLGKRTRRLTRFYGARTMPEMFEKRYASKHLKLVTALIIFVFLVPYAASVYTGLGYLFQLIFGIEFWVVVLIMAALTAIYLFFGGYLATVLTDFFQGIIMILGVVVMIVCVMNYQATEGIVNTLGEKLAAVPGFFPSLTKENGAPFGYTLIMLILLTSVGVWGLPQIVHKFHTVKSEKAIKQATYVSTAFALIIGVCAYFVGCFSRYIIEGGALTDMMSGANGKNSDMIIPEILVKALPAGLLGLLVILIMSASMSTLASLSLTSASAVSVDLYKGYIKKSASEKTVKLLMRILCVAFVGVSVVIAITKPAGIVELMSLSWGTIAGCFLPPYVYGLYSKKATKAGAYAAIITGLGVTGILYLISLLIPASAAAFLSPPAIGVAAMATSMLVTPLVARFSKPPADVRIDELFAVFKKPLANEPETPPAQPEEPNEILSQGDAT